MELLNKKFNYLSTILPMVNIDLIIKNEKKEILLAWRDDEMFKGWHVPGRIVRYGKSLEQTCIDCSKIEIGYKLYSEFYELFQKIHKKSQIRGHFITFVFGTFLSINKKLLLNNNKKEYENGYLKWFKQCPKNIIKAHKHYERYFN